MISVEEALERILSKITVLDSEGKFILDSLGQVLAEDIYSKIDIPPLDNSAMDGYAVKYRSIKKTNVAQPVILDVIGEVAAGSLPTQAVIEGTAVRIMTGAPIPDGADTVVPFEKTDEEQRRVVGRSLDQIGILHPIAEGSNIRQAGEDVVKGSLVLRKGTTLRPQEIGVLASLGLKTVHVVRRPQIAILSTGDELLDLGHPPEPGKIYNSNNKNKYV